MGVKFVKPEELGAEITKALMDYTKEVSEAIEKEVDSSAKELVKEVKANSPKKTGDYQKGWTSKKEKKQGSATRIIYNKNKPWLVHLLEMGHGKRGGAGRVGGIPHLGPAHDRIKNQFLNNVENIIKRGG